MNDNGFQKLRKLVQRECADAEVMVSPWPRLAGFCTLAALVAWIWGATWAAHYVGRNIIQVNVSIFMSKMYAPTSPSPQDSTTPETEVSRQPAEVPSNTVPREDALKMLEEQRAKQVETIKTRSGDFQTQFQRQQWVQGSVMVIWTVVMVLTAAFMLGASLAGLMGSYRSRRWHRHVVFWTFLSTACSIGGIWILSRWGGFPPIQDYSLLGYIAMIQCSYAILILIALTATYRSTALEELTHLR